MNNLQDYIMTNSNGDLLLSPMQELMDELATSKRDENFAGTSKVKAYDAQQGEIDIMEVLMELKEVSEYELTDLSDEDQEYILYEQSVNSAKSDNTYNYNPPLSNHINFDIVTMDNDMIALVIRVHIGLDVRAGYTNSAVLFYDDAYTILEALASYRIVREAQYTKDGETFWITLSASATSDEIVIYDDGSYSESYIAIDPTDDDEVLEACRELVEIDEPLSISLL